MAEKGADKAGIWQLWRDMVSSAVVAILDQAMLSATNLLIGLSFIRLADKTDYGIYTQLFGVLLLMQSVQAALINGPLAVMAPKRRARGLRAISAILFRLQLLIAAVLAVLAFTGVNIAGWGLHMPALSVSLAIPFAVTVFALWLREYAREYYFLRLNVHATFLVDLLYATLMVSALGIGAWRGSLGTEWVLWGMGLANLVAGGAGMWLARLRPFAAHGHSGPVLRETWSMGRWTLPSIATTWLQNQSFIFIVAGVIGVTAAADVAAGRLLLMPAGLCTTAWANVFTPRASRWVGQADFDTLRKVTVVSIAGLWAVIGGYFLVLWLGFDLLETHVLGENYAGLLPVAGAWALFFDCNALRVVGTLSLVGGGHFRELFWYGVVSLAVGLPLTVGFTVWIGRAGPMLGLAVGELVLAAMIWVHGMPRMKRHWSAVVAERRGGGAPAA